MRIVTFFAAVLLLLVSASAYAQQPVTVVGTAPVPGNCVKFFSTTQIQDAGLTCNGGGGGSSPGGSNGQVQYNNSGSFGGLTNAQLTALINPATATLPGTAPAFPNNTTTFLRGDGTYATPLFGNVSGPGSATTVGDIAEWNNTGPPFVLKDVTPSAMLDQVCATNSDIMIRATGTWGCGTFRARLTGNTLVYVNGNSTSATCAADSSISSFTCAGGNDSTGNGTTAAPYQTLAAGLVAARAFDEAGFQITIVLAYTTPNSAGALNYGGTFALGPANGAQGPGGNAMFITGDKNSPTSVSITAHNSALSEGIYASDGFVGRLEFLQLDNQGTASDGARAGQGAILDVTGVTCGASWTSTGGACLYVEKGGVINGATLTLAGCPGTFLQMTGGVFNAGDVSNPVQNSTISIPSAIACSTATVIATGNAELLGFTNGTFIGSGVASTTGTRAILAGSSFVLYTGASSVNSIFPGNVNATIQDSATTNHAGDTRTVPLPIASGGTGVASGTAFLQTQPITVDFSAAGDNTITPQLPSGFTRLGNVQVLISSASADISAANFGLFTTTGGGGTAIIASATAVTVTTSADNTNNNAQLTNAANLSTESYTPVGGTVQFRVGSTAASGRTAKVSLQFNPLP